MYVKGKLLAVNLVEYSTDVLKSETRERISNKSLNLLTYRRLEWSSKCSFFMAAPRGLVFTPLTDRGAECKHHMKQQQ